MKKKLKFIIISALLLAVLLCVSISLMSCPSESEAEESESETETVFEPAIGSGEQGELYDRYVEYKENASLAFSANNPMGKEAFSYEIADGKAKIVKYIGEEAIVVIPEAIDGATVAEIAAGAFSGSIIRAVYIPDTVEIIAQGAFNGCDHLSTLRLPFIGDGNDNQFIGYVFGADEPDKNAVALPASLDMVIIGEKCSSVQDGAFKGAKALSAVVLPDSVTRIGKMAFYQCYDLVYFSCNGVSEIDEYAFAYCRALYNIDISSAQSVAKGALYSCSSLNSIALALGEGDYIGRVFDATSPEYNDELVPDTLRTVTVAEGCTGIPDMAFYSCQYITKINLPDSLEKIGIRSFYACRSLGEITVPDRVKTISDDAFFGCENLVTLKLGASLEVIGMQAFYGCGAIKSVECPQSLKEIKASAFYGCKSLASVSLGGTEKIGRDAFGDCPGLEPIDYSGVSVEE